MGKFEDLVEQVRDEGLEDVAAELESFKGSALRQKAQERDEFERRALDAEKRLQEQVFGPLKERAFQEFGVDFDALRPAEKEILQTLRPEGDKEVTEDWVAAQVDKYGFPLREGAGQASAEEEPKAAAIARTAMASPTSRRGSGNSELKPEEVAEWGIDKQQRLLAAHPEAYERLKRGETVRVAFDE